MELLKVLHILQEVLIKGYFLCLLAVPYKYLISPIPSICTDSIQTHLQEVPGTAAKQGRWHHLCRDLNT